MPSILPPEPCTAQELQALADDLAQQAARITAISELLRKNPESEPLFVFMRQTFDIGIRHVRNFADEAETSFRAWKMGKPQTAKTTKGGPYVKKGASKPKAKPKPRG